jgi:hypothetical protein
MVPSMPAEIQQLLPPLWRGILIVAWFALGIFVRLVQQPAKPKQPQ